MLLSFDAVPSVGPSRGSDAVFVAPFEPEKPTTPAKPDFSSPFAQKRLLGDRPVPPSLHRMVRFDFLSGPIWRLRQVDALLSTSVEVGHMRGLSLAFQYAILVSPNRAVLRTVEMPLGAGVVLRGTLQRLRLYGSIGLTAGVLLHRAADDRVVIRRVDPAFQLPIRFAWTIAGAGLSLSLIQGYSVRRRSYERRGVEVWARNAYRIGFALGIHFDVSAGRGRWIRGGHKEERR